MKDSGGETEVGIMLSYYEIYNDKVFDLFEPPEKRAPAGLPLREKDGKTIVVGLSERACGDLKDFEKLYIEANNNRSTAGTKLNAQSSRSHAILMVKLSQTTGDETRVSTASAIDLAGSEDNRRTGNDKERLVESASINKSLFVLSQCVDAIGRGDKRIPYRESKMTRILSLGQNNGITIMILNLSPLRSYHLDTLSSLNVSSRAKRIEVREIENEVVFKQPPRSNGMSNLQRQALRPLAHNMNVSAAASKEKGDEKPEKPEKPLKSFSVYSDRSLSGPRLNMTQNSTRPSTTNAAKRPSDSGPSGRPTKISRPAPVQANAAQLSAAKIEEMVERKVSEILANRALEQPAAAAPVEISEAVQRRLDALEKKIDDGAQDDARAEGLRFLLMAKQHKERGEDASALKMYELALPFFPGQDKLVKKMDHLRERIRAKRDADMEKKRPALATTQQLPTPEASFDAPPKKSKKSQDEDDDYHEPNEAIDEHDDSFAYKVPPKSAKRSKSSKQVNMKVLADAGPPSPRTSTLLDIVNSRDVTMIKGLSGFGAKRAKDLVEFLELMHEDDGGKIESLAQLTSVPGMGAKTVEKAYEGLASLSAM